MADPHRSYTPVWVFFVILLLVMILFGAPFIRLSPPYPDGEGGPVLPPAGCVNSQPTYTTGPRLLGEFTVRVAEFPPRGRAEACELSAELRRRRINNYVFERDANKHWVVAVGRFTTRQQAANMRDLLRRKGYRAADVYTPLDDIIRVIQPRPICGCYAPTGP